MGRNDERPRGAADLADGRARNRELTEQDAEIHALGRRNIARVREHVPPVGRLREDREIGTERRGHLCDEIVGEAMAYVFRAEALFDAGEYSRVPWCDYTCSWIL